MSSLASLELIPTELFFCILSFLPFDSYKSLSLCSRSCRAKTNPSLFHGITLQHSSEQLSQAVSSFGNEGGLGKVRQNVKHVTLNLGVRPTSIQNKVDFIRYYKLSAATLRMFPSLDSMEISWSTVPMVHNFERNLLNELLGLLYDECLPFQTIRKFSFRIMMLDPTVVLYDEDTEINSDPNLQQTESTSTPKVSELVIGNDKNAVLSTPISLPTTLEEVTFCYHLQIKTPLYPLSNLLTQSLQRVCLIFRPPNSCVYFADNYGFPDDIFPNVVDLRISPRFLYNGIYTFKTLTKIFPNVDRLIIYLDRFMMANNHLVYGSNHWMKSTYDAISEFRKLRKARLFWFEDFNDVTGGEYMLEYMLAEIVKKWRINAPDLETVEFVRETRSWEREKPDWKDAVTCMVCMEDGKEVVKWNERYRAEWLEYDER